MPKRRTVNRAAGLGDHELQQLSYHLTAAVDSLVQFLRGLAQPTRPVEAERAVNAKPIRPAERTPKGQPASWPSIISAATRLMQEAPTRVWRPAELCQTLKAQGVRPKHTRGMHMAIMPRLREAGLIVEKANGTFTAKPTEKTKQVEKPARNERKPAKSPAEPARASSPPERSTKASASIEALIAAARTLLDADSARTWKPIEFVRAIRETGVKFGSWRGVHFYLPKILKDAGLIEMKGDGRLTAPAKPDAAAQEEQRDASPAVQRDDHASTIASLEHEVEALAPRLTNMTPRERVAQLAVWAGRARKIDEELTERRIPANSGLKNQIKQIIARLKKLRKSLGCGWVDALSFGWSTDWNIYIDFNRSVAAAEPSSLTGDQKKKYFRDLLKSILTIRQGYARDLDAPALVIEASQVLDEREPSLVEAMKKFGRHEDRRTSSGEPEAPFRRQDDAAHRMAAENSEAQHNGLPRSVLKITRGKTLLIAGGRGSHDTQRLAVRRALQFKSVDWITGERHSNPAELFSLAIRNKKYDIVLLMPGTDDTEPLVLACKEAGSKLMYLTRGPSIPSVAEAITGVPVVGGHAPEWVEK